MEPSVKISRQPRPPRSHQVSRNGAGSPRQEPCGGGAVKELHPHDLFVLGRSIQPWSDVGFSKSFTSRVHQCLRDAGLTNASALQKAVASNLKDGLEAVIVFKPVDGELEQLRRSLAYMVPVLTALQSVPFQYPTNLEYNSITPCVLVITPTAASSSNLFFRMHRFLKNSFPSAFPLIEYSTTSRFGFGTGKYLHVLITDIKSLQESRNHSKGGICYDKLKYLVFDEIQCYLDKEGYKNVVQDVIRVAKLHDIRLNGFQTLSVLTLSARWGTGLQAFYEMLDPSAVIFIESYVELLRFAQIKWIVGCAKTDFDEDKINLLRDIAERGMKDHKKIVVACSTGVKANKIAKALVEFAGRVDVISKSTRFSEFSPKGCKFEGREVVVITDELLDQRIIGDCTYFLSFDGATQSISHQECIGVENLGLRFMWSSLPKLERVASNQTPFRKTNLIATYLLGGGKRLNNNIGGFYGFSKLIDNVELSPQFEEFGKQAWEKQLSQIPLCDGFKLFGVCNKYEGHTCFKRHAFNESDIDGNIPGNGQIVFTVMECNRQNLNKYTGKLLSHYVIQDGKRILLKSFDDERVRRSLLLKEYCSDKLLYTDVVTNEVYGAFLNEQYFRVKVLSKKSFVQSASRMEEIHVHLIDDGITKTVQSKDLFNVPLGVKTWPPLVVTIILANLCPRNNELEFSLGWSDKPEADRFAKGVTFRANVWLTLSNTVWVRPMLKENETGWSLERNFIEKLCAVVNPKHLDELMQSARRIGRKYPHFDYLCIELCKRAFGDLCQRFHKENSPPPWWAFLDLDPTLTAGPSKIKVTDVTDPWLFHGVHSKFESILKSVEEDANEWAEKLINKRDCLALDFFFDSLQPGQCVLAKHKCNQRWKRALTLERTLDSSGTEAFDVLLVDSGKIQKGVKAGEVLPISTNLVERLPFQAIALRLNHIKPAGFTSQWSPEEIKDFKEMIFKEDDASYVHVTAVKPASAKDDDSTRPQRCYDALVMCKGEEIGTTLVEKFGASKARDVTELTTLMQTLIRTMRRSENVGESEDDAVDAEGSFYDDFDVCIGSPGEKKSHSWFNDLAESTKENLSQIESTTKSGNQAKVPLKNRDGVPANLVKESNTWQVNENSVSTASTSKNVTINANDGRLCPTVYWHQTKANIIFRIQIADIKDYKLTIDRDRRTVKFTSPNYDFNVELFGKVLPEYDSSPTGQRLQIVFTKKSMNYDLWPRINYSETQKLTWLKKDPEYLESDDDDVEEQEISLEVHSDSHEDDQSDGSVDSDDYEDRLFKASDKFFGEDDLQNVLGATEKHFSKIYEQNLLSKLDDTKTTN